MASDPRVLLDAAFAAYGDIPPVGYINTGKTITNDSGLHLSVYRKIGAEEYIIAFRGTEQNVADFSADAHKGWTQYKDSHKDIQALIKEILATGGHIDITGHSLGGALAQFAAYDFIATALEEGLDTRKVNLTTWNALGGKWALKEFRDYDATIAYHLVATHYYRNDDLVSRLGRGHVGGDCIELRDPQGQIEGVLPAHMYDALLKGLEAGTGKIKNPDYLPIADSSQMIAAALIGYLETKPKSEDPINDFLDSFIGTSLLQIPIFENRLIVDIGILTGTIAIQQNLSRYDWSLPTLQMILDRAIKDYRISPAGCFSLLNGVLTSIELLTKDSSPLKAMMLEARPILSRIMDNLNASLAAIDMDRAMLLYWILMRGELMGLAGPEDIALLPGESSLMPFKDLMINGLTQAASYSCPLVLDLDGDGIETLSVEALNLHFDHDGNRYAERSGWVGPDDALLVYDRDGNQEIDKGAELFGSQTRLANGSLAANGFEALKEFDRNADGRVDAVDADWARLQLWRDRNSNGELDAGELQTLAAAGVASLELAYDNANVVDEQGNQHRQLGRYRTSQGELRSLVDVWFQVDQAQTRDLATVPIDPEIAALPDISGMGNVPSLHQAMQRDGSRQLRQLVEQWRLSSAELRPSLIRQLIYRWTGVFNLPSTPVRGLDDLRSLSALEALLGTRYRDGGGIQVNSAGITIGLTFEKLCGVVNDLLAAPELLEGVLRPDLLHLEPERSGYHWDGLGVISALQHRYGDQPSDSLLLRLGRAMRSLPAAGAELVASFRLLALEGSTPLGQRLWLLLVDEQIHRTSTSDWLTGRDANELIEGGEGIDNMAAGSGDDVLLGRGQNDLMLGQAGDDVLDGGTGNDDLDGGDGDDTVIGGKGDDILKGGSGKNLYIFAAGDGQDWIQGAPKTSGTDINTILFEGNSRAQDLKVGRRGTDLTLEPGLNDFVTIQSFLPMFPGDQALCPVYSVQFSDGTKLDHATLKHLALQGTNADDNILGTIDDDSINAGAGNDIVQGGTGHDLLEGGSGDDALYGDGGDDSLDGGTGNDSLIGGLGNNVYHFSRGGGQDQIVTWDNTQPEDINRIICADDIRPSDLHVTRPFNEVQISIKGTQDSISILYVFEGDHRNRSCNPVREVIFKDGTIWTLEAMIVMTMQGNDEADYLWGIESDDTIRGMGGDDIINGAKGNDLLLGGSGNDNIDGSFGNDTLEGGPGNDLLSDGGGTNVFRFAKGDGQDVITCIWDYLDAPNNTLEFNLGIKPADVSASRLGWGRDLVLRFAGSNDQITLKDYFYIDSYYNPGALLQQVRFQDGVTWKAQDLVDLALTGTAAAEELVGSTGHDRISGAGGNDTLVGGKGNDTLHGGLGNNVYQYSLYDGSDTLASYFDPSTTRQNALTFGRQIKPADIKSTRVGNKLRLDILSSGESITVEDFFRDGNVLNNYNPIQSVRFSDGTSWSAPTLAGMVSNLINGTKTDNTLKGGGGDDWIEGLAGNDQLLGLAGNDLLIGGAGNDTLLGGDGDDLLDGGDGLDTASYAEALGPVSVDLGLSGSQATGAGGFDTLVAVEHLIGGGSGDRLLGNGANNRLDGGDGDDWIEGGAGNDTLIGGNQLGGDSLSYAQATAAVKVSLALTTAQSTGGAGSDVISGFEHLLGSRFSDHLSGSATANRIDGGAGNDTLQGGGGADSLQGGEGLDLFLFASPGDAGNGSGNRDLICDWTSGDRIDLATIDARSDQSGNQAFTWIGNAAFSGLGQLRYELLSNGQGLLEGNCSGSLAADFQLELQGGPALGATAFVL